MNHRSIIEGIVCILISFAAVFAKSPDKGYIHGQVTDGRTGNQLVGVNIVLLGTQLGAATDNHGHFHIDYVPRGTHALQATMVGYRPVVIDGLVIRDGETLTRDIVLEEDFLEGEEVVVTATRTPKMLKDAPVRTMLISSDRIEEKAATNLYEALESEPGIRVEQQCSACNFSQIRMSGLEGGYAQTLIDGQQIFTGLAGVYGLQQIQTGSIERIEVVKGAGSALYGSDALAGVVNVVMKEPGLQPTLNVGSNIGSYGTNHFVASGTHRTGNIGIIFSAQKDIESEIDVSGADSYPFDDTGKDLFTDRVKTSNFGGSAKLFWYDGMGENSKIKLNANVINEFRKGGYIPQWDDPYSPDSEHIRTERYETGMGLEKTFRSGNKIDMNAIYVTHYRNATNGAAWDKGIEAGMMDEDLNYTDAGNAYVDEHGFAEFRENYYPKPFIADEKLYFGDARYSHPIGRHSLFAGVQYRRSNLDQSLNGEPSDKSADDIGVYVQGDFYLNNIFEVVAGLRHDSHHSEDDLTATEYDESAVNPRAALRVSATDDLTFRANFGTGFRVPYLFAEDLHLCAAAPRIYKGPDLKAEKATSFSMGADLYKADYRLGLSVFKTDIEDKIEFITPEEDVVPSGYDYRWLNVGSASTQGFELSAGGISHRGFFEYSADLVYTDAKFDKLRFNKEDYPGDDSRWENSDRIPRSPEWTGNVSCSFNPGNWRLTAQVNYIGSMFIDHVPEEDSNLLRIEKTDAFVTVNTRIACLIKRDFTLFIGAKNLFDYIQPKRDITDAAYIWAPLYGRIVYAGFDIAVR